VGVDISRLVLRTLAEQGFSQRSDPVFLQCFEAAELRRIRQELASDLRLVQLIAESSEDADLQTTAGLEDTAAYADGVGPSLDRLYSLADTDGQPVSSGLVSAAHAAGLAVHPYTFRADALATGFTSFAELVDW